MAGALAQASVHVLSNARQKALLCALPTASGGSTGMAPVTPGCRTERPRYAPGGRRAHARSRARPEQTPVHLLKAARPPPALRALAAADHRRCRPERRPAPAARPAGRRRGRRAQGLPTPRARPRRRRPRARAPTPGRAAAVAGLQSARASSSSAVWLTHARCTVSGLGTQNGHLASAVDLGLTPFTRCFSRSGPCLPGPCQRRACPGSMHTPLAPAAPEPAAPSSPHRAADGLGKLQRHVRARQRPVRAQAPVLRQRRCARGRHAGAARRRGRSHGRHQARQCVQQPRARGRLLPVWLLWGPAAQRPHKIEVIAKEPTAHASAPGGWARASAPRRLAGAGAAAQTPGPRTVLLHEETQYRSSRIDKSSHTSLISYGTVRSTAWSGAHAGPRSSTGSSGSNSDRRQRARIPSRLDAQMATGEAAPSKLRLVDEPLQQHVQRRQQRRARQRARVLVRRGAQLGRRGRQARGQAQRVRERMPAQLRALQHFGKAAPGAKSISVLLPDGGGALPSTHPLSHPTLHMPSARSRRALAPPRLLPAILS